jgi:hypothetical protein
MVITFRIGDLSGDGSRGVNYFEAIAAGAATTFWSSRVAGDERWISTDATFQSASTGVSDRPSQNEVMRVSQAPLMNRHREAWPGALMHELTSRHSVQVGVANDGLAASSNSVQTRMTRENFIYVLLAAGKIA